MNQTSCGASQRVFPAAPVVDRYYPASAIEQARTTLLRVVERGEGPALVIGPPGTGKTLLCQLLAHQLRWRCRTALLATGRIRTARSLLQHILFHLGWPYRGMDEGELRLSLAEQIAAPQSCPHGLLLVVDEAHWLPAALLEELRLLTNTARGGRPSVHLVLAGTGRLEEKLSSPRLEMLNQRVAARCYLDRLTWEETCAYVAAHLEAAGLAVGTIFQNEALTTVHQLSEGIPRLINQLCDHALVTISAECRPLDSQAIEQTWADLQQLPAPQTDTPARGEDGPQVETVVEFGQLADEPLEESAGEDRGELVSAEDDAVPHDHLLEKTDASKIGEAAQNHEAADARQPCSSAAEQSSPESAPTLFEQEEVVVDPYAALDARFFRHRHVELDSESQQLAAALEQIIRSRCEQSPTADGPTAVAMRSSEVVVISAPDRPAEQAGCSREPPADSDLRQTHRVGDNASDGAGLQQDAASSTDCRSQMFDDPPPPAGSLAARAVPVNQVESVAAPSEPPELVIVEDDGSDQPVRKSVPMPRATHCRHYRQLLDRLRRAD